MEGRTIPSYTWIYQSIQEYTRIHSSQAVLIFGTRYLVNELVNLSDVNKFKMKIDKLQRYKIFQKFYFLFFFFFINVMMIYTLHKWCSFR